MAVATADQTLAWEERHRVRAIVAAVLGGIFTLGGGLYNGLALQDTPTPTFLESLARLPDPGSLGAETTLRIAQFEFYDANATDLLLGALLLGLGALGAAGALTYLGFATRHRTERMPRFALYVPVVGGVLVFVGSILTAIGTIQLVDTLLDSQRTVDAVRDAERPDLLYAGRIIQGVGSLTLAMAYVLVALNAMRAGLLTRFMGIIGIFAGVLVILPLVAVAPILQPFWLISLGALIAGRWPGGVPPAWRTGKEEPWPSQAQMREQRMAQTKERRGRKGAPERPGSAETGPEGDDAPERPPHPSSKKRKRKRRG